MPRFRGALDGLDRRRFLQVMAAPMVLAALSGCGPEADPRQLVPYVEQPPDLVPSVPALLRDRVHPCRLRGGRAAAACDGAPGQDRGQQAASRQHRRGKRADAGQPVEHSTTRAARRRSSARGQVQSWPGFVAALLRPPPGSAGDRRQGACGCLPEPSPPRPSRSRSPICNVSSPRCAGSNGSRSAATPSSAPTRKLFGHALDRVYDLTEAQIIFGVESDLISNVPGWLAYARQFAASRRPYDTAGRMSRVYAIESTPTLLGAKADHRLALQPAEIAVALRHIAGAVGAGPREWTQAETGRNPWLAAAAADLTAHRGDVLVHAGREQPTEIHLLVNAINSALGAFGSTIGLIEPVAASAAAPQSLAELVADMEAGAVDTLLMIDTNPVYSAPADLDFAARAEARAVLRNPQPLCGRNRAGEHLDRSEIARIRDLERRSCV